MTLTLRFAAILLAVGLPALAWGADPQCAQSPGDVIKVCVSVQAGEGRAVFEVSRLGRPVLAASNLGLDFVGEPRARYSAITGVERRSSDSSWEQPWGEERIIRDQHTQMVVRLKGSTPFTSSVEVTFRLFDDGIGFRYRFTAIPAGREVGVSADQTSFHTLGDYEAW